MLRAYGSRANLEIYFGRSELLAGLFAVDEEEVFPSEGDQPERIFSEVVVDPDARIAEETSERSHVPPRVVRCTTEQRLRAVGSAQTA